jgi:hypothetical protein
MPRTNGGNGRAAQYHPLDARAMERACRKLAADLRREYAEGWGPVPLSRTLDDPPQSISRLEAADSLEAQGDRWAAEANGGPRNIRDRAALGEP